MLCGVLSFALVYAAAGLTRGASRREVEKFDASILAALRRNCSAVSLYYYYRSILCESCSQFDLLPLIYLN